MGPWLLPILIGVGALFLLKGGKSSPGAASIFGAFIPPTSGGLPNYPASTPDSVPTGIAGAIASAFKPPTTEMARALPPTMDTGPLLPTAPPVVQPMPEPAFMGGASWEPSLLDTWHAGVLSSGGTEDDFAALAVAASLVPPITGPTVETRSGRGHF